MSSNKEYMEALGIDWRTYEPPPHEKWEPPQKDQVTPEHRTKEETKEVSTSLDTKPKKKYKKYILWLLYGLIIWFSIWLVTAKVDKAPSNTAKTSAVDPIIKIINENFTTMLGNLDSLSQNVTDNAKAIYDMGRRIAGFNRRISTLEDRVLDVDPATYTLIKNFFNEPIRPGYQRTLTLKGCVPSKRTLPLR